LNSKGSDGAVKQNVIQEKSYSFALKAIVAYRRLTESKEYVLSKQMLRASTSIGANVEEAIAGQSRADFISKMSIASKEARETRYWLRLLRDAGLMEKRAAEELLKEVTEMVLILTSIVKSTTEATVVKRRA
jgi:four helix bundle protein